MKSLKEMADELSGLTECGQIRSYFDKECCPEIYLYDSSKLFNFFCCCEEVGFALRNYDFKKAEELIEMYKEDF